jgi:serine/threonine protein kinase
MTLMRTIGQKSQVKVNTSLLLYIVLLFTEKIEAKLLVNKLLTHDPKERITAEEALNDPWITNRTDSGINLAPTVRKGFNNRKTLQSLVTVVAAINKMKIRHPLVESEEEE